VKMAIAHTAVSVPSCKPNLMPFHIDYNGPAAVSTFMHVEKLVDHVESAGHDLPVQTKNPPENCSVIASGEALRLQTTQGSNTFDDPPTLARTATESTFLTESSSSSSNLLSASFSQFPTKSQDPPIEDLDNRFISTFRGRSIHGLTINLPAGYAGVVLRAPSDQDSFDGNTLVASSGTRRGDEQRTKNVDLDVEVSWGQRRRGRLRSSAAPRKGTVIAISDDDPQSSISLNDKPFGHDIEMAEPLSTPNAFDGRLRILVPTARFHSFTLWQADHMVNKSNDEYWRTLTEWIGLADAIHNIDT